MTNELIKVQTNQEGEQRVSARELYKVLGVVKRFSTWFSQYQDMYVEGTDWTGVPGGTPVKGGNGSVQYLGADVKIMDRFFRHRKVPLPRKIFKTRISA